MSERIDPTKQVLSLCCGGKKCPEFSVKNDGVSIADAGLLGENTIELTQEQATALRAWLENKGF